MSEQKKSRRQVLEEFVARKPDDAFSRYGLALECLNGGDASAADQHFRALIERNGEYVPAYLMYAQLLVRESRGEEIPPTIVEGCLCILAATRPPHSKLSGIIVVGPHAA